MCVCMYVCVYVYMCVCVCIICEMSHTVQVMSILCSTGNVGNYVLHLWFYLLVDVKVVKVLLQPKPQCDSSIWLWTVVYVSQNNTGFAVLPAVHYISV